MSKVKLNKDREDLEVGLANMADTNTGNSFDNLTAAQQKHLKELDKQKGSISAKIRYLDTERFTTTQIAKLLGKRYQHVRNVLTTELKRPIKN